MSPGISARILVVEDDPRVRRLTVRRLRLLGHDTLEAEDGPSALAAFGAGDGVDLLLTQGERFLVDRGLGVRPEGPQPDIGCLTRISADRAPTPTVFDRSAPACGIAREHGARCPTAARWTPADQASGTILPITAGTRLFMSAPSYADRITIDGARRHGKPCVRDTRITVYDVLGYMAGGMSETELLGDFPELERDDVRACLAFAADSERRLVHVQAA